MRLSAADRVMLYWPPTEAKEGGDMAPTGLLGWTHDGCDAKMPPAGKSAKCHTFTKLKRTYHLLI